MIGVLPDDDSFYFVKRAVVECIEDEFGGWVDGARRIFVAHKFCQLGKVRLFKLAALKSELEELLGTTVDLLRMRKQLDGTILKDSVMKDLIYV